MVANDLVPILNANTRKSRDFNKKNVLGHFERFATRKADIKCSQLMAHDLTSYFDDGEWREMEKDLQDGRQTLAGAIKCLQVVEDVRTDYTRDNSLLTEK